MREKYYIGGVKSILSVTWSPRCYQQTFKRNMESNTGGILESYNVHTKAPQKPDGDKKS